MKYFRRCALILLSLGLLVSLAACFLYCSYSAANRAQASVEERIVWSLELTCLKLLANCGDELAQFELASTLILGFQTKCDPVKGYEWMARSASQGYASAQYAHGMSLYFGDYVEMNRAKGLEWMARAAANGHVKAQARFEELLYRDESDKAAEAAKNRAAGIE